MSWLMVELLSAPSLSTEKYVTPWLSRIFKIIRLGTLVAELSCGFRDWVFRRSAECMMDGGAAACRLHVYVGFGFVH